MSWSLAIFIDSELEINIKFPTCWDGQNVESSSGDHVMYAPECDANEHNECFEFDCPSSHPVRMPEIHLYVRVLGYEENCSRFLPNLTSIMSIGRRSCVL